MHLNFVYRSELSDWFLKENTEDKSERHKEQIQGDLEDLLDKRNEIRDDPEWGPYQRKPKRTRQRIDRKIWNDAQDALEENRKKDKECP